ncbi:rlmN1 [Symbiodinium sp. CCMP2592]|nr:rlmN1 [Symbiodinium sp. CCMP2592]
MALDELAEKAGAGEEVRRYLKLRGAGTEVVKLGDTEKPIAAAVLLFMRRMAVQAQQAAATPAASPLPTGIGASLASGPTSSDDKVPRTLPANVWSDQIKKYEATVTQGRSRAFPQRQVLGAEAALAKLWHYLKVTRSFAPLPLGEILSRRSFDATGQVNALSKRKHKSELVVDVDRDRLVAEEQDDSWEPRSMMAVCDALNALRWAYILLEYGHEFDVNELFDVLIQRSHVWQLCTELRSGKTFTEAMTVVKEDVHLYQETMSKPQNSPQKPGGDRKRKLNEDSPAKTETWKQTSGKWIGDKGGLTHTRRLHRMSDMLTMCAGLQFVLRRKGKTPVTSLRLVILLAHDKAGRQAMEGQCRGQSGGSSSATTSFPATATDYHISEFVQRGGDHPPRFLLGGRVCLTGSQRLGRPIRCTFQWEIDDAARRVSKLVSSRGDLRQDTPEAAAKAIREVRGGDRDVLLVTAAAPCPDFSRLNASAGGRSGASGDLFVAFAKFLRKLLSFFPGRKACLLAENVLMQNAGDVQYFSRELCAEPIIADASDYQLISRPRLWWSWIPWTDVDVYPDTQQKLQWKKADNRLAKLRLWVPPDTVADMQPDGLHFHPDVFGGQTLVALSYHACSDRVWWLEDHRQYAPWFYDERNMLTAGDSSFHLLPVETKEALHHFDRGFTAHPDNSEKDRNRLLGNSWHVGVAQNLLHFALKHGIVVLPGPFGPSGSIASQMTDLASATRVASQEPLPVRRAAEMNEHAHMVPVQGMWEHWHAAYQAVHPALLPVVLDPGLELTIRRLTHLSPSRLTSLREQVIADIQRQKVSMSGATDRWFRSLPQHVQRAYTLEDGAIVQIPLFIALLRGCGYPDCDSLEEALTFGFPVTGAIDHTPGWRPRLDDKYSAPISSGSFAALNRGYVLQKLQRSRVDPEWQALLSEIIAEVHKGRMQGPFRAPPDWPRQCVPIHSHSGFACCLELPETDIRVAGAFSVKQTGSDGSDKVRRCEDYRRSFHNATVGASDIPAHDTIHTFVSVLLRLQREGFLTKVWCQDLWAAYRQFPVREPREAFTLLATPTGPTLWCHGVLPFGAASSVWCFNRCIDALAYLARTLLIILIIHYVGDIGGPDTADSAASGFWAFAELCELLGMRLKPAKAQPPDIRHKLLGVILEILPEGIRLSPAPDRIAKVVAMMQTALQSDSLDPMVAQRLAGKLNFLQTTMFGQAGAAAVRPIYSRGQAVAGSAEVRLNSALRCSLKFLIKLLEASKPKWIPFCPTPDDHSVLYADAFFELGDSSFGLSDEPPQHWNNRSSCMYRNGWGFVVRTPHGVRYGAGRVPAEVLSRFTSRKAFIYSLEIFAQIVAAITCQDVLSPFWLGFCDNQAGRSALERGYGREDSINNLIACFWCVASLKNWQPHFQWVPSEQNISDPFSRGDSSIGETHGWSQLHSDFSDFWQILLRVVSDFDFAVGAVPKDLGSSCLLIVVSGCDGESPFTARVPTLCGFEYPTCTSISIQGPRSSGNMPATNADTQKLVGVSTLMVENVARRFEGALSSMSKAEQSLSEGSDVEEDPIEDATFQEAMSAYTIHGRMENIVCQMEILLAEVLDTLNEDAMGHGLDVLTGKAIGTELKNPHESKVNITMERVVELLTALSSEANRFDYDSWLVIVRDNNDYMEELVQEFKEQKHEIRKMLMINSIEASEFLNSRLLIAATNFTKWFEKMRKLADEFEDFVAKQRMTRGAPDRMLARDRFLLHSRLRKETSTRMHEIREALKKQATSNHNRRLDAQVELRLSDRQDMERDESAAFEHHKRSRKRKTTGDASTARRSSLASKRSSHMEEQIFNYIQIARHHLDELSLLVQEKNEKEGRAKDVLLKLHFKQLAMERKKLRAAAKGSSTFGSSAFESVMPGRSAALYAHKKRHQHEDFNVSSHLLQQVAISRELNALTVMEANGEDALMNAETQALGDLDSSDDSPLAAAATAPAPMSNSVANAMHAADNRAREDALRDAASAAAALKAACGSEGVVPVPAVNPYALAAPVASSLPPPNPPSPLQTVIKEAGQALGTPKSKPKRDKQTESPEKKAKLASERSRRGLDPPPLFGGGSDPSRVSPKTRDAPAGPEIYHLDPQTPPTWVRDLQNMVATGHRDLLSELQTHKVHISEVAAQVQGIDRKQEALHRAQGDMATRLDNMEAEVRDLRAKSRSVSPAPHRAAEQSPRGSTAASTAGGRPVIDDLQIVIGGWDEARRGEVEQEVRLLFEEIEASPLLQNITIPFVRTRFARVELLFTNSNLAERRRIQSLTINALKQKLDGYVSSVPGQQKAKLWVTRNRSREDREKIRALVSVKEWATKHLSEAFIDFDWSGRLWIRSEQCLFWHRYKQPDENSMMLTNQAGDETGWFVDVRQLGRLLSISPEQARDELQN